MVRLMPTGHNHTVECQSSPARLGIGLYLHGTVELAGAAFGLECNLDFTLFAGSYRSFRKIRFGASASAIGDGDDRQRLVAGIGESVDG